MLSQLSSNSQPKRGQNRKKREPWGTPSFKRKVDMEEMEEMQTKVARTQRASFIDHLTCFEYRAKHISNTDIDQIHFQTVKWKLKVNTIKQGSQDLKPGQSAPTAQALNPELSCRLRKQILQRLGEEDRRGKTFNKVKNGVLFEIYKRIREWVLKKSELNLAAKRL